MKEARYYLKLNDQNVQCQLCPHACVIKPDETSRCQTRYNDKGTLRSLSYGLISGCSVDPIEKKPLYHFQPGSAILSIGSFGCNFTCTFCQNWTIAQHKPQTSSVSIEEMLTLVENTPNNIGLAYTYNEPTVSYEFIYDLAKEVHDAGYKNIMITNGFIMPDPLEALLPFIDAFNIDLKAFNDNFYKDLIAKECMRPELPILYNVNFGHTSPMAILPLGAKAQIDCDQKTLKILESGVI